MSISGVIAGAGLDAPANLAAWKAQTRRYSGVAEYGFFTCLSAGLLQVG